MITIMFKYNNNQLKKGLRGEKKMQFAINGYIIIIVVRIVGQRGSREKHLIYFYFDLFKSPIFKSFLFLFLT